MQFENRRRILADDVRQGRKAVDQGRRIKRRLDVDFKVRLNDDFRLRHVAAHGLQEPLVDPKRPEPAPRRRRGRVRPLPIGDVHVPERQGESFEEALDVAALHALESVRRVVRNWGAVIEILILIEIPVALLDGVELFVHLELLRDHEERMMRFQIRDQV